MITRRQIIIGGAATTAATALAAPFVLRHAAQPAFRFGTWNIACAAPLYFGKALPQIAQYIKDNTIDICVMQEVDRFARTSEFLDFPRRLTEMTGYHAVYGPASIEMPHNPDGPPREYGNAIISRFPIIEHHDYDLNKPAEPERLFEWNNDNRTLLMARIAPPSAQPLWVATTHLSATVTESTYIARKFQCKNILHLLDAHTAPDDGIILGGDFNTEPASEEMGVLQKRFQNATRDIGATWPLDYNLSEQKPTTSIDHILLRNARAANVRKHILPRLSDHALVTADIRPPRP